MHVSLSTLEHRPWPLPQEPWQWRQSWLDLAFAHYRIEKSLLEGLLPPGLKIQEFDGSAWLGLVPFRMQGVMRRPLPDVPGFSMFPELNLRTYVEAEGKPGVWFFSLDADSWPVVLGGRNIFGLPYFLANMRQKIQTDGIEFSSSRRKSPAEFHAQYRPRGQVFLARKGTFEYWATERYCLYAANHHGEISRTEVHHAPWPLQNCEIEISKSSILEASGFAPSAEAPICHFSSGVHVVSFPSRVLK